MKKFLFLPLASVLLFSQSALSERWELASLQKKWRNGEQVTAAYVNEKTKDYKKILKINKTVYKQFSENMKSKKPFARGQIENESIINFVTQMLQYGVIQARGAFLKNDFKLYWSEVDLWFQFAADLAYEESTLVGLRFSHVLRSLWLDEIEKNLKKNPAQFHQARSHIQALRAPWPIDRVILSEAKRNLNGAALSQAEKIALEIQKNPYQATAEVMKKKNLQQTQSLAFIKEFWRDQDIEMMKNEVNRLQLLAAAAQWVDYTLQHKKPPASWTDMSYTAPVDYSTGKSMTWEPLEQMMKSVDIKAPSRP
jgi:hypothetical protein